MIMAVIVFVKVHAAGASVGVVVPVMFMFV